VNATAETAVEAEAAPIPEWTIDELAQLAGVPTRTIREYQSQALLPPPRRRGRVGIYGGTHLSRLRLIGRLQDRGYSLAGIADLLGQWREGADLAEVLGLQPDELVHVDEPGAPATLAQLQHLLPTLVPEHLRALERTGVVEACGPDRYCVPSPSLLQLARDAAAAGFPPARILTLLRGIKRAADVATSTVLDELTRLPPDAEPVAVETLLHRGRGLLAHGVGRLTVHQIGRELGIDDERDVEAGIARVVRRERTR
jgi:DNA-binding transcriptional MerR regulator